MMATTVELDSGAWSLDPSTWTSPNKEHRSWMGGVIVIRDEFNVFKRKFEPQRTYT